MRSKMQLYKFKINYIANEYLCFSGQVNLCYFSNVFENLSEKGLCTLKKPPAMSLKRAAALSKQKGKRAKSAKEQEEHQAIGGKDVSFFLFRALGKILHCKREY